MSSTGSPYSAGATFLVILLLFVIVRIRRIVTGTRISKARSIAYSVYYLGFASFLILGSFLGGVPLYFVAVYAAIGAAGLYGAHRAVNRRLVFWRGADGSVYAKGGIIIYMIYVIALIVRIAIYFIYLPSALTFTLPFPTLSGTALVAAIATDALLAFGSGLLSGRNIRLYQRYVAIERGEDMIPDSPPTTSGLS